MPRSFRRKPDICMALMQALPDRAAKAAAWPLTIGLCAAAHFEFMRIISPLAVTMGF